MIKTDIKQLTKLRDVIEEEKSLINLKNKLVNTTSSDSFAVPEDIASQFPDAYFLSTYEDKMRNIIPEKALVLINPCNQVENGDVAAVVANGRLVLRRYKKVRNSVTLFPDSNNSTYLPETFEASNVEVLGKLVWYMAPFDIQFKKEC